MVTHMASGRGMCAAASAVTNGQVRGQTTQMRHSDMRTRSTMERECSASASQKQWPSTVRPCEHREETRWGSTQLLEHVQPYRLDTHEVATVDVDFFIWE